MQITDKKRELLKKLYTLAERGDRGEREAARQQLDRLLEKYDITEADLADETLDMYWFSFKGEFEKKLLHQVAYKVCPERKMYHYTSGKGSKSQQAVECTAAEAVQIRIEFDFYKHALEEEMKFFFRAFIQKHRIFADTPPADNERAPELSHKELLRMSMPMNGMEDRTLHKMIEA